MTQTIVMPIEGDKVLYVLPKHNYCRSHGQSRPALVVKVWSPGVINLQVFTDGENDFTSEHPGSNGLFWVTSVVYNATGLEGTWHWPLDRAGE